MIFLLLPIWLHSLCRSPTDCSTAVYRAGPPNCSRQAGRAPPQQSHSWVLRLTQLNRNSGSHSRSLVVYKQQKRVGSTMLRGQVTASISNRPTQCRSGQTGTHVSAATYRHHEDPQETIELCASQRAVSIWRKRSIIIIIIIIEDKDKKTRWNKKGQKRGRP